MFQRDILETLLKTTFPKISSLLLLVLGVANAQMDWQFQDVPIPQGSFTQIICWDFGTCNLIGSRPLPGASFILHTSNGGDSWNIQVEDGTKYFSAMDFASLNVGWVVGCEGDTFSHCTRGMLLGTKDSGLTWQRRTLPFDDFTVVQFIQAVDESTAWIVAENFPTGIQALARTTDSGTTWSRYEIPGADGISFITRDVGYVFNQYQIGQTSDGGMTWNWEDLMYGREAAAFTLDVNNAWVANGYPYPFLWRTQDGGYSWAPIFNIGSVERVDNYIVTLWFLDAFRGWLVSQQRFWGDPSGLFYTSDGGHHWTSLAGSIPYLPYLSLTGGAFLDQNAAWLIGYTVDREPFVLRSVPQ